MLRANARRFLKGNRQRTKMWLGIGAQQRPPAEEQENLPEVM
jgi:hypothetical protein